MNDDLNEMRETPKGKSEPEQQIEQNMNELEKHYEAVRFTLKLLNTPELVHPCVLAGYRMVSDSRVTNNTDILDGEGVVKMWFEYIDKIVDESKKIAKEKHGNISDRPGN